MIKLLSKLFIKNNTDYSSFKVKEEYSVLCGVVGIILNIICSVSKIVVGGLVGSIAILSDGLNNLSDMGSSLVSIIGAKLSNRKPDKEHPFGHGRYEYIASLIVAFLILYMGIELGVSSVEKLINPTPIEFNIYIVLALVLSILIKIYMASYNAIYGKKLNSLTLKATSADSISDSIMTSVILIGTLAQHFIPAFASIPVDAIMGIGVSIFILIAGFKMSKEVIAQILGAPPTEELINKISTIVLEGEGILGIHDLMVHDYGPGRFFASVHAEVSDTCNIVEAHEVIDAVEARLYREMGLIMTIHMDPISTSEEVQKYKDLVDDVVRAYNKDFSIHDFRIVDGENQINLIFDLVISHPFIDKKDEIGKEIAALIKEKDNRFYCVIQVETSYI